MTFKDSVNIPKYKVFVEELRARYFLDDICLYFDNLSVHRSHAIRDRLDELGIAYIFNPPYSPEFNGIEFVFSIFKNRIKRERLNAILHRRKMDLNKEIMKAFHSIDRLNIINCIQHSLNNLFGNKNI